MSISRDRHTKRDYREQQATYNTSVEAYNEVLINLVMLTKCHYQYKRNLLGLIGISSNIADPPCKNVGNKIHTKNTLASYMETCTLFIYTSGTKLAS